LNKQPPGSETARDNGRASSNRRIGIGEKIGHNCRGQQRQSQQAPGLRHINTFGSGNISFARIGTTLPATRGRAQ
jgi:hypothetical protein